MPRKSSRTPGPAPHSRAGAPCPCGLGAPYGECCGPFHSGRAAAPTAERLMRSRYSAFAVGDAGYLLRTWSAGTRLGSLDLDPRVRWTGLEILGTTGGSAFHREGTVEFVARCRVGAETAEQRENSAFVREDGRWVYVGGAG
ncbi:YchJ family protein [Actinacidiphila sp. ITFR-21]|uniref:YchJ family protein n=1 Tax=Actinacidiphila sp. ITFR-21 TaxID=3075199 RepID=UPI00288A040C|nr:YchJ family metal-binding protein [Streptomyces sp. ITFR-21]WNI14526.1 YchJ family metal-binding protein [Streptomyces sp. ITFR-21]